MITIKEIAELAGVSRGTVDRVINKRGGVGDAVEKRIVEIIHKYGYKPNRAARTLANRKKLYSIGVISSSLDNVFFVDVVKGIREAEREVEEVGVSLRYEEIAKFSVRDQVDSIDRMMESGIDALAINPINDESVRNRLVEVGRAGLPIVTFNTDIEGVDKLAYIGCDYHKTGRIAAGMIAFACREKANVAVVAGSTKSLGHSQRVEGFCEEIRNFPKMRVETVVEMFDDELTSYCKVKDLLATTDSIDAFYFAAGGKEGGIRAIQEAKNGKKMKIVTVDLDPFTLECLQSGTVSATICQQPYVQGYEPVKQLVNFILYGDRPKKVVQYTEAEIVIRQSIV